MNHLKKYKVFEWMNPKAPNIILWVFLGWAAAIAANGVSYQKYLVNK